MSKRSNMWSYYPRQIEECSKSPEEICGFK
jgi:hypothetical protein